jgi:hypothetical protein
MSHPAPFAPAALLVSLISARQEWLEEAQGLLTERFGPAETSDLLPFDQTAYYAAELGSPLSRRFLRFADLIPPDSLVQVKLACLGLEGRLSQEGRRRVNIDPGLLSAERLILSTGKNFTHRVPLAEGIYADLTLIYTGGSFQPQPWTFPDYRSPEIIDLLNRLRAGYIAQLRGLGSWPPKRSEPKCSGA